VSPLGTKRISNTVRKFGKVHKDTLHLFEIYCMQLSNYTHAETGNPENFGHK